MHREKDAARPGRRVGSGGLVALQDAFAAVEDAIQRLAETLLPEPAVVLPVGILLDVDRAARDAKALAVLLDRDVDDLAVARRSAPFLPMLARQRPARLAAFFFCQRQAAKPPPSRTRAAEECEATADAAVLDDGFDVGHERQRRRAERRRRRARHEPERAQVVAEAREVFAPVVGAQAPPGSLGELVERRRQRGGGGRLATPSHISGMTWALAATPAASSSRTGSSSRSMQRWPSLSRAPRYSASPGRAGSAHRAGRA